MNARRLAPYAPSMVALAMLGCTEAGATVAAPAVAHRGPWQQFCEQASSVPQASQLVAARGAEGWELVAMYNGVLCYKRPSPEAPRPPIAAPATPGGSPHVPELRDPGF